VKNITLKRNRFTDGTFVLRRMEGGNVRYFHVSKSGISVEYQKDGISNAYIDNNLKVGGETKTFPDSMPLDDIARIVMVFVLDDSVEVLYKTAGGVVNCYKFEATDFTVFVRYENVFRFETGILGDSRRTQLAFSYDSRYFSPTYYIDENNERKKYGYYELDYPCATFGRKVSFEITQKGVSLHGIGHFDPFLLMLRDAYECLSEDEKTSLHRFLSIAERYINNLKVNRDYDYELVLNGDECDEVQELIDKLAKKLNATWKRECLFSDAEQGHPAGKEVYQYSKSYYELIWQWQIEFYGSGDYVTIKCGTSTLDDVMKILGTDIRNKLLPYFNYNKFYNDYPDTQLLNWKYEYFPGLPDMNKEDYPCFHCKSENIWKYRNEDMLSDNSDTTLYCKTCGYYHRRVIKYAAYSDESNDYVHDSYLYKFGIYSNFSVLRKVLWFENENGKYRIELWDDGMMAEFTNLEGERIDTLRLNSIYIFWDDEQVGFSFKEGVIWLLRLSFTDAQPILDHIGVINKKLPDLHTLKERYFITS